MGNDTDIDLDGADRQRREVFALFGLAAYQAQCLEKQIGMLLASTLNSDFLRSTPEEREVFFATEASRTLGQLVRDLKTRMKVPRELEARLQEGLQLRNWLSHDYFWDRAHDILSSSGREEMINELSTAAATLGELDDLLTALSESWLKAAGIDVESLYQELTDSAPDRVDRQPKSRSRGL